MFSGAVSGATTVTGKKKEYDQTKRRVAVSDMCIEWNNQVAISDFVPVLQDELRRLNITSRVYPVGAEPTDCQAILYYSAARAWDRPMFSDHQEPYLSQAQLSVQQQGRLVAQERFNLDDSITGRWATTQTKLRPVVEALIFSEEKKSEPASRITR